MRKTHKSGAECPAVFSIYTDLSHTDFKESKPAGKAPEHNSVRSRNRGSTFGESSEVGARDTPAGALTLLGWLGAHSAPIGFARRHNQEISLCVDVETPWLYTKDGGFHSHHINVE